MKLSIYTFIQNGLYYDYHTVAMLKHHLSLADEIVVNEGYSTDGTYEAISDISPKIRVFRNKWDETLPADWYVGFKNWARQQCTGDWCILLDSDEFIPEWEFGRLRSTLSQSDRNVFPFHFSHFYGNYRVLRARHALKRMPILGQRIHRNLDSAIVWGDGANVRIDGSPHEEPEMANAFECHHFGEVRDPARLRQKWRRQAKQSLSDGGRWDRTPGFVFDLFPHSWLDPDFLQDLDIYNGPYIRAVQDDPDEFIRDDLYLYRLLSTRAGSDR